MRVRVRAWEPMTATLERLTGRVRVRVRVRGWVRVRVTG